MAQLHMPRRHGMGLQPLPCTSAGVLHRPLQPMFIRTTRKSVPPPAAAWGSPPEPFAQSSLVSIADAQRQMQQQMDALMGMSGPEFAGLEDRLDRQFREMDRQMDRAFADMDRVQRELDAELARSMRQLQQQQPGVSIQRSEERSHGSYRYYESIQIRSGGSMTALVPAHSHASGLFSPLLFVAVVLAGAYAAVTAAFNRNYELTTYRRDGRWQLLLLWPFLLPFSKNFRQQFSSALRGEKVKVMQSNDDAGSSSSSSSSSVGSSSV